MPITENGAASWPHRISDTVMAAGSWGWRQLKKTIPRNENVLRAAVEISKHSVGKRACCAPRALLRCPCAHVPPPAMPAVGELTSAKTVALLQAQFQAAVNAILPGAFPETPGQPLLGLSRFHAGRGSRLPHLAPRLFPLKI